MHPFHMLGVAGVFGGYEITPRTPSVSRGRGPTIEPCSISGMH
jgi:hypothetical protein